MSSKVPCGECGKLILPTTAERNSGKCIPCAKGYRANIEASKEFYARQRELDQTDPSRLLWKKLHQSVYSGVADRFDDLSAAQKNYWAVGLLIGEVYNGGFDQYFHNSSGDYYKVALEGLRTIGASASTILLESAKHLMFGEHTVPTTQTDRWEAINNSVSKELVRLDKAFCEDPDNIDDLLVGYAQTSGLFE